MRILDHLGEEGRRNLVGVLGQNLAGGLDQTQAAASVDQG